MTTKTSFVTFSWSESVGRHPISRTRLSRCAIAVRATSAIVITPRAPAPAGFADDGVELHQMQDGVNLDRPPHRRGRILGCPGLRVGAVLAVEDKETIEPWSGRLHGSITGVSVTAVDGDAEGRG